ncbi:MAG: DNRLRE domain-containing protein [Opitutales bacterium]
MRLCPDFWRAAALLVAPLAAQDLSVPAVFDTDSYIFIGTNNDRAAHITINPHRDDSSHFNFGVIRFDLDAVPAEGRKLLSVHLPFFVEGSITDGFVEADSGTATVHVVALATSYDEYLQPSVAKRAWYDLDLHGQPILGTYEFASVEGDGLGRYTVDVTDAVDAWLAAPETNHGFGLWGEVGSVDLSSSDGPAELAPRLVVEAEVTGLTYAAWLEDHFAATERENAALVAWTADPDGDGRDNGREYHQGTDPRQPDEAAWTCTPGANGVVLFSIPLAADRLDGAAVVERASDLSDWAPVDEAAVERTANRLQVTVAPADRAQFVRLRIQAP